MKSEEYLRDNPHERSRPRAQTPVQETPKVDFRMLRNQNVSADIFARGQELQQKNRARQNSTYPWKYMVSGEVHNEGTIAYGVDLAELTCSCRWFQITGSACKHLIAALLDYALQQDLD